MITSRALSLVPKSALIRAVRHCEHANWKGNVSTVTGAIVFSLMVDCLQNLPFDITNHRKLAIKFALFFGSAFWTPFLIFRWQLNKN